MEVVNSQPQLQLQKNRKETMTNSFESLFNKNYKEYYPKIYRQLYYLLGSNELAQDLAQEVFMKYYQTQKEPEFIGPWLSKIAVRKAYNHIRGEKRRIKREESVFDWIKEIYSTEDEVFRHEEIRVVRQLLSQMDKKQSICLLLKFSGFTYDEIHQASGIPKNNISQLIARGKQKFASLYQKEGE